MRRPRLRAIGGQVAAIALPGPLRGVVELEDGTVIETRNARSMVIFVPLGSDVTLRAIGDRISLTGTVLPTHLVEAACGGRHSRWRTALGEHSPRIAGALRWLGDVSKAGDRDADPLVMRLLARLLASAFGDLDRRPDDSWLPPAALARISAANEEELDLTSIATLASDAGLSTSAFSRAFRGSTGQTPGEFLSETRLDRIAALLATTDRPLAEITRLVGLASVTHVSSLFGSRHGVGVRRCRSRLANGLTAIAEENEDGAQC